MSKIAAPTSAELAILRVLWTHGPATVRQINDIMRADRQIGYSTTLKMVQIMTEKGLLLKDESVRPQVYKPARAEARTQLQLIDELIQRAFGGSASKLVLRAAAAKRITPDELAEIKKLIESEEKPASNSGEKHMIYRLGWTLMHSLWEGVVVAVFLAIVLTFVPRRSAVARYLCHLTAMFALALAFVITLVLSPIPPVPAVVAVSLAPVATLNSPANSGLLPMPMEDHVPLSRPQNFSTRISGWIDAVSPPAAWLWFAGVTFLGIIRVAGWFSVQRLRVVKTEPVNSAILAVAKRLADRLDLKQPFEILISHFTETPLVIGWLRPVILLPASAITGLSAKQLESILAHELAHIRRHDYLVNLLQIACETTLFYHPAVWWFSRQIRLEREQACDDVAILLCEDRQEYARSLAAIEELRLGAAMALAARGSGGRQMLIRIRRILGPAEDAPRWGLQALVGFLVVITAVVALYSQSKSDAKSPTTRPLQLQNDAPRRSPFTAVRWNGELPEARFKDDWFAVVSIDDLPVTRIMDYLKGSNDVAPQKHFAEDLVEVLRDMGHEPGNTVKLKLQTLDTHKTVEIPDAPMTEENRRSVLKSARSVSATEKADTHGISEFDADRKRLADFKNRYEIESKLAEADVQSMSRELADMGGISVGGAASPKEMELNRWVAEQIELKTQKLTADTEYAQFAEKKKQGEVPPAIRKAVEEDAGLARLRASIDSVQSDLEDAKTSSGPGTPKVVNLTSKLDQLQNNLSEKTHSLTAQALQDYLGDLNWRRDNIDQRLQNIDDQVEQLKAALARIEDKNAALASRRNDIARNRELVKQYDQRLAEMDQTLRSEKLEPVTKTESDPSDPNFIFDIPFEKGTEQFHDGDTITITSVKGTQADMHGGICCIKGTYTLASRDQAMLAAFVTAADPKQGFGFYNQTQTKTIHKGAGAFTLLLPINIKGYPHVSFYDEKSSFGGIYIGTGDSVLSN